MTLAPDLGPAPAPLSFDEGEFKAALAPVLSRLLGGDGRVAVLERMSGNVNLVLKLGYRGRLLGARVALNAHRFRYEKIIVKEVFAVLLLAYGSGRLGDARLRQIVDGVLSRPSGGHVNHRWARPILWYDWSRTVLPYSFFVFEWIEGEALWTRPSPDLYHRAGAQLADLHRLAFEHFYEDVFAIDRAALAWHDRFRAAWDKELAEASAVLPAALAGWLAKVDVSALAAGVPCLVHNDYTGGNILVDAGGGLRLIDWDNWVVDCAELDMVKMKYWTAVGPDGRLGHDARLFDAFRRGYDQAAAHPVDPGRLAAYEGLWLMRTLNFESGRAAAPPPPSPPSDPAAGAPASWQGVYPPAETYRNLIQALADKRESA